MGAFIITRIGFCPECEKNERLKTDQSFLVYGHVHGWQVHRALRNSPYCGYVPHMYRLEKTIGENVIVYRVCGVAGCKAEWKVINGIYNLVIGTNDWERQVMTKKSWEALIANPFRNDLSFKV
jgi:hypothetical protein